MSDNPVYVVSDLHLGAVPAETERRFRRFLAHIGATGASGLVINGDLFDFWFEYRTVVPRRHFRVLALLADLIDAGLPIWFVGGNHDAWGGDFLREEVGLRFVEQPGHLMLAGHRCLVAHGDGVGTGDLGYRALRRVIRHPVVTGAFRALHPDLGSRIAGLASATEHRTDGHDPGIPGRARFIEQWAREQIAGDPELEFVLAGHAHLPLVLEVAPGRFYANSGDWIQHFSYLTLRPGEPPRLASWQD